VKPSGPGARSTGISWIVRQTSFERKANIEKRGVYHRQAKESEVKICFPAAPRAQNVIKMLEERFSLFLFSHKVRITNAYAFDVILPTHVAGL